MFDRTWWIGLVATGWLASPILAEDDWAGLGHELGCYKLTTLRNMLADDVPKGKTLKPFATPDEFVTQLETLGLHPKKTTPAGEAGSPMHGIVVVEFDGGRSVAFVKRHSCTRFDD